MTEAEFQTAVIELAQLCGWTVAHFRSVRTTRSDGSTFYATPVAADGKGFPDLVLVRDRVVFAELKGPRGVVETDQAEWHEVLAGAGADVRVWYPKDWDEIEATLRRRPAVMGKLESV